VSQQAGAGQRPGPGDRLGERAPPWRSHLRGQPPGRRRGIHRKPSAGRAGITVTRL